MPDLSDSVFSSIPSAFWVFLGVGLLGIWFSTFTRGSAKMKNGVPSYRFPPGPLDHSALVALDNYKYVSSEYTPLDNFMNTYWWTPLSDYLPMTLAPNLVTLTGVSILIPACALNLYYSPNFTTPIPEWLSILTFIGLFVYETMDALDGKQARRTGASSPLGQLFDHGVDACVVTLVGISVAAATCVGPFGFFLLLVNLQLPFFLAQWGEKITHVLRTNIGPIGVTEGQFLAFFICLCPGIFGKLFWTTPIATWAPSFLLDLLSIIGEFTKTFAISFDASSMTNGQLLLATYCFSSIFATLFALFSALAHVRSSPRLFFRAIMELLPVAVFLTLCGMWSQQPSFQITPRAMPFILGLPFSHMTAQMIVAAMTRTKFCVIQPILLAFAVLVIPTFLETEYGISLPVLVKEYCGSDSPLFAVVEFICEPKNILPVVTVITAIVPFRWATNACFQIAQHLNIFVLQLGKRFPDLSYKKDQ